MKFLLYFALTISAVQSYRTESGQQINNAEPTHVEHASIKSHDISESHVDNNTEIKELDRRTKNRSKKSKKSKEVKKKTKKQKKSKSTNAPSMLKTNSPIDVPASQRIFFSGIESASCLDKGRLDLNWKSPVIAPSSQITQDDIMYHIFVARGNYDFSIANGINPNANLEDLINIFDTQNDEKTYTKLEGSHNGMQINSNYFNENHTVIVLAQVEDEISGSLRGEPVYIHDVKAVVRQGMSPKIFDATESLQIEITSSEPANENGTIIEVFKFNGNVKKVKRLKPNKVIAGTTSNGVPYLGMVTNVTVTSRNEVIVATNNCELNDIFETFSGSGFTNVADNEVDDARQAGGTRNVFYIQKSHTEEIVDGLTLSITLRAYVRIEWSIRITFWQGLRSMSLAALFGFRAEANLDFSKEITKDKTFNKRIWTGPFAINVVGWIFVPIIITTQPFIDFESKVSAKLSLAMQVGAWVEGNARLGVSKDGKTFKDDISNSFESGVIDPRDTGKAELTLDAEAGMKASVDVLLYGAFGGNLGLKPAVVFGAKASSTDRFLWPKFHLVQLDKFEIDAKLYFPMSIKFFGKSLLDFSPSISQKMLMLPSVEKEVIDVRCGSTEGYAVDIKFAKKADEGLILNSIISPNSIYWESDESSKIWKFEQRQGSMEASLYYIGNDWSSISGPKGSLWTVSTPQIPAIPYTLVKETSINYIDTCVNLRAKHNSGQL